MVYSPYAKHADHDQSTHGNWAEGWSGKGDKPIGTLDVAGTKLRVVQPDVTGRGHLIRSLRAKDESGNLVALISWYEDGRISNVRTDPPYQRQGVATRLFEMAKEMEPSLRHNPENLTEEGAAWARTVKSISPYAKHKGPGDHPSGSPQSVHGRGGGSRYVIEEVGHQEASLPVYMVRDTKTNKFQSTHTNREGAERAIERFEAQDAAPARRPVPTFFGRPVSEGPSTGVSPSRVLDDFATDPYNEWTAPDGRRYYVKHGGQGSEEIWVEYELNGAQMDSRAFTHDGPDGSWYKHRLHGFPGGAGGSGVVTDQRRQAAELIDGMGLDPTDFGLSPAESIEPEIATTDWLDPRTRESISRTINHNESQLESLYHDLDTEKELAGVYSGTLDPVQTDDVIQVQDRIRQLEAETMRLRVLQNNPPLPGMDPPLPERMAGEKKPITSATGKVTATFEDPYSLSDRAYESGDVVSDWTPEDIFEGTVELSDGSRFTAQMEDTGYSNTRARGHIYSESGEQIGTFDRTLNTDGDVYNSSFTIVPEYRGQGIGTLFLAHWEEELAAAGFEQMRVQTVDIGNYAWAVSGYEWDSGSEGYFEFMEDMLNEDEEYSAEGESDLVDSWGQDAVNEMREMVQGVRDGHWYPEPYEIASIGSTHPTTHGGRRRHLGKQIMLDGPGWYGIKYLDHYNFRKALSYSILYNEWARRDPAAIENDAPEWWAAVRTLLGKDEPTEVEKIYSPYAKHAAPIHPGTGTDQSVHGGTARFNYKPGSDDLKRLRHETNLQSEVDRFAGNNYQFSLTREEAENFQDEFLMWVDREVITNRSVWVRVDAGELDDIHETGQLLSLRETGFSNGSENIKARDAWEAEALDWKKGQPSIIYGYLDKEHGFLPPDGYKGAGIPLDMYGNAAFKLKPGAAARTTWTYSDSLGTDTYPSLVTDPHIGSLDSGNWWSVWWSKRAADSETEYQYLEAQIHGGVKLSDIEAAYIPYGVPDSTVDKYRAAGIDTIRVPPPQ